MTDEPACWGAWFDGLAHKLAHGIPASDPQPTPHTTLEGEAIGPHPAGHDDAVRMPDYSTSGWVEEYDDV